MSMPVILTRTGLRQHEVVTSRQTHGSNSLQLREDKIFLHVLKDVVLEPMFLLLVLACTIYFVLHELNEAFIMLGSLFIVAGISLFQEYRSRNAIQALRKISSPKATVIRNNVTIEIPTEEIVVNDILLVEEGEIIAADGLVIDAKDFSVDEAILTGEAYSVYKNAGDSSTVYKGTLVTSGSATLKVVAVGIKTMFGKIGLSLKEVEVVQTPLQIQVKAFVKNMVWFGAAAFVLVFGYNYYQSNSLLFGLLQGLTLAMSILPEEIPVAFSTFQALGAFRLLKHNIIVKQPQYVETLGSATVICVDKTGTLTQNRMSIAHVYNAINKTSYNVELGNVLPKEVIEYAMWASETNPFDPMEKAIHVAYEKVYDNDQRIYFKQVHEYPLSGRPPLMTHVFENLSGETIIACKGAPEAILRQCKLTETEVKEIALQAKFYAEQGYRVLGVGKAEWNNQIFPLQQDEFIFSFLGLIAFFDPPKENIIQTISAFHKSRIQVKMITGDYAATAKAIARQLNLQNYEECLTGDDVLQLSKEELQSKVEKINVYARMFPEAKLKVIEALKDNGEVVAMTGDGVNDAPALKAAQIGIAMGLHGSEVAQGAASLIITDDDLYHMTEAVALGRKIYNNLQKAIQYIVSIHIPIILIVTLPLILMWKFTNFFSPVHVIFLELIMGPTCSIIYENEPIEPGAILRPPRKLSTTFLSLKQLTISILQGLIIAAGCLSIGYFYLQNGNEITARTVIFITLLLANIFLTLVNRSFYYSLITTLRYKNYMVTLIIGITLLLVLSALYVPAVRNLFKLTALPLSLIIQCSLCAVISTCWIEIYKWTRRRGTSKTAFG
jgi:P-type Ca2+ transporter type 2C